MDLSMLPDLVLDHGKIEWSQVSNLKESDEIIYDKTNIFLRSNHDSGMGLYKSQSLKGFTAKELLLSIIHFEKMDRVPEDRSYIHFGGLEKIDKNCFQIVWTR